MIKISKTGVLFSVIFLALAAFLGILIFINVQETGSDFVNVQKPESAGLKAMLANPVANMQLTTAREVKRFQEDKDITRGRSYAELKVRYEPVGNNTKGDVYDEIVENIENSGWKRDSYSVGRNDYYNGSLRSSLEVNAGYKSDLNYV